jgi:hypothetical protein
MIVSDDSSILRREEVTPGRDTLLGVLRLNEKEGGLMRRLLCLFFTTFLACILILGCGKPEEPKKPAAPAVAEKKEGDKTEKAAGEKKEGAQAAKPVEVKPRDTQPGEAKPAAEKPPAEEKK